MEGWGRCTATATATLPEKSIASEEGGEEGRLTYSARWFGGEERERERERDRKLKRKRKAGLPRS